MAAGFLDALIASGAPSTLTSFTSIPLPDGESVAKWFHCHSR